MFVRLSSVMLLAACCGYCCPATASDESSAVVERVSADIKFLASDALQGRAVETEGIELAAKRILDVYETAGLKPTVAGSYRQKFSIATGKTVVGSKTKLNLTGPDGTKVELKVGQDFQPLQVGTNGDAASELVFVGYGISSNEDAYDDYQGVDVEGRIVVMIRREPRQRVDGNRFRGRRTSAHAYINNKLALAKKKKVAAILFVNDPVSFKDSKDELAQPHEFGADSRGVPFLHVSQKTINDLLAKSPLTVPHDGQEIKLSSLQEVETQIDQNLKPVSQPLTGWSADLAVHFETESQDGFNLLGILEGEGDLAKEFVVVGAHYDHIGLGAFGSKSPSRKGQIHNGADDNASGTAAVLELARRLSQGPRPQRSIIFACFSGEERGLLGSKYYVSAPVVPLADTIGMLNFDMIGSLRNSKMDIGGVGTGTGLRAIVSAADETSELKVNIIEHAFAGSDHLPFLQSNVPAMFCFTGMTNRYHTPDDDFEQINVEGAVQVVDLAEDLLRGMADMPVRPEFQKVSGRTRKVPYLGAIPFLSAEEGVQGVRIRVVRTDSPAQNAGLQVGDLITVANGQNVTDYQSLISILRKLSGGITISMTVTRGEETIPLRVTLGNTK